MDSTTISNGTTEAKINHHGAELCSLRHAGGDEVIWQAGPEWQRHAPVLFPIVGRLNNDEYRHAGQRYRMTQHGFARDRDFQPIGGDRSSCAFVLADDEATRAVYPFRFRLEIRYALGDKGLRVTYRVSNMGDEEMAASIGAHPAFRWPLADGIPKQDHRLMFDHNETGPARMLENGLMKHEPVKSPLNGRELKLVNHLFDDDAVILQRIASKQVRYEAPGHKVPAIEVGWEGFDRIGIWCKPTATGTADFVCLEPWSGNADPVGYRGDLFGKPGIVRIAPHKFVERVVTIRIVPPKA